MKWQLNACMLAWALCGVGVAVAEGEGAAAKEPAAKTEPAKAAAAEPAVKTDKAAAPEAAKAAAEPAASKAADEDQKAPAEPPKADSDQGKAAPTKAAPVKAAETPKAKKAAKATAKAVPVKDAKPATGTIVEIKTSEGLIKVELADKEAPISVKNFLAYVGDKFYDGTVFHRVIDGFMVQGGGYQIEADKLNEKPTKPSIANEAKNGLKNDRGTLAMARTSDPNSATAQFFINLVNNDRLNAPNPDGHGYAVFGKVIDGMDTVDKIGKAKTGMRFGMQDVPVADVKIESISVAKPTSH